MRTRRFMHEYGINQEPLAAVAMADYYHAQFNPRAVMYGHPLTREQYDKSRWIVEPFHLYDCCMENDGSAALIVTTADRARDAKQKPAYIMAAAQGSNYRHNATIENSFDLRLVQLQDAGSAPVRDGWNHAQRRRLRADV